MSSTDHLCPSAPNFDAAGVTFRCWVTDDGHRYEWRSTCGRCFAGRNIGSGTYWASIDRRIIGSNYPKLSKAVYDAALWLSKSGDRRAA